MPRLNPYLLFNGNAAEVIAFYKKTLNATVEYIQYYENAPFATTDEWKKKILHASLTVNNARLMVSDSSPDVVVTQGNSIQLTLNFNTDTNIDSMFNALAVDGRVTTPLQETFWAKKFGMLVDKFGIHWMFNYDDKV